MQKIIPTLLIFLFLLLPQLSLASTISDFSPVSHWTCDEEGGVRYDSSALGNDLTNNNTVGFDTGLLGNACVFQISNSEYLSITDSAQSGLDITGDMSFSLWVYYDSLPSAGSDRALISKWNGGGWMLYSRVSSGTQYLSLGINSAVNVSIPWTPSSATWYHIVATYKQSTGDVVIYKDGSLLGSGTASNLNPNNSNSFSIGMYENGSALFDGMQDEISVFNYVLSSTDVSTLYNGGTPLDYSGVGDPVDPPATTTPTTTPLSSTGDIVFMLAVIIFFLGSMWTGFVFSIFRSKK